MATNPQILQPVPPGGGGGGGVEASIVQFVTGPGANNEALSFPGAPTEGNLMVALISSYNIDNTNIAADWTLLGFSQNGRFNTVVLYKWAGASEPASQTPASGGYSGAMTMYECVANGIVFGANLPVTSAENPVAQSFKNPCAGAALLLGHFCNQEGQNQYATAIDSGAIVDAQHSGSYTGGDASVDAFHISGFAAGTTTVTATYAGNAVVSTPYAVIR